jgi:hypothetical protein
VKALLYFMVSIAIKTWYEKQREKNFPELLLKNIESGGMRVNIRTHRSDN